MSDVAVQQNDPMAGVMEAMTKKPTGKRGKLTVEICIMAQALYAKSSGQGQPMPPNDTQQVGLKTGWGGQGR